MNTVQQPQQPTWIWYPGDFEVWLGNIFNNRRTERGAMFPPFWKQDSHYPTVEFAKTVVLDEEERISIFTEGHYNFAIDGKLQPPHHAVIPRGEHRLSIKVWNQATPPALYIAGPTVHTDSTWLTTYEDKIWIDENGQAHGSGIYVPAASWCFNEPTTPPSHFQLERIEMQPVSKEHITPSGTLYDFGRETFGYLKLIGLKGQGVDIYYGESREEALDKEHCETLDSIPHHPTPITHHQSPITNHQSPITNPPYTIDSSKAFRYVFIETSAETSYDSVAMDYEFLPQPRSGTFRCSDDELNRIWDVAAYTLDLTTREFFMDGIKRDRWTWSGDAIQSYLMNYYLHFDTECVKRTIRQLRGKDPVTAHVNTIMDYTFYWFKSILDYYEYTADASFVSEMWPRMVTLMDYCLSRVNAEGMTEGQADDWIFVDWVDFPMHKRGTLCFEQMLFCKALQTMAHCARLTGHDDSHYAALATRLHQNIRRTFWSSHDHAYLHAQEDGTLNRQITKFPNMFAILYGLADETERQQIMDYVMLNPHIPPITTPYMRFYELEALCMAGLQPQVLRDIKDYWGGMLRCGATTFWEKYNPGEQGSEHLAMYGRPYGKSLCHAWGASPLYLLGRYFLGVEPAKPGYEEFSIRPVLGGMAWMEGSVPTPQGTISLRMDSHTLRVHATQCSGYLTIRSSTPPVSSSGHPVLCGSAAESLPSAPPPPGTYHLWISPNEPVTLTGSFE